MMMVKIELSILRWVKLGRKVKKSLENGPESERSSLVYLPHPFIVSGGR